MTSAVQVPAFWQVNSLSELSETCDKEDDPPELHVDDELSNAYLIVICVLLIRLAGATLGHTRSTSTWPWSIESISHQPAHRDQRC